MDIIKTKKKMQEWADSVRKEGASSGFVPTMGALHAGHSSLIKRARSENGRTVVSIFVNPTQFGPGEDFGSYPRPFDEDRRMCEKLGVDAVFCPETAEMYSGPGYTSVRVSSITSSMCGKMRPGHFEGVATVVAKLFNCVKPDKAYFGQKDYQQFRVIEALVRDLDLDIDLVMCPVVRDDDGLAVSSRNKYLDGSQRAAAPGIYRALLEGESMIKGGEKNGALAVKRIKESIKKSLPGCRIDYAGVFDALDLSPVKNIGADVVIAAAVYVGKARLIDNILVKL